MPGAPQVDALLTENSEAAAKLKSRMFPEPYAIHWAEGKAHQAHALPLAPAAQAPRSDVKVFAI
jgi:hypothetical protein